MKRHVPSSRHLERLFGTEYASENILPGFSIQLTCFVIGFNNNTISFFIYFHVLHVIFIKIIAKIKELIFLAQGTHHGMIS